MSTIEMLLVVAVALVVIALLLGGWYLWRHRSLRRRFGPEYQRLAEQSGPMAADRELRKREQRHAKLDLRELSAPERERYRTAWTQVQTTFVDTPDQAIGAAQQLVTDLAAARGYPTDDLDEQAAQLSVEHARTLDRYRTAREINQRHERGEASTEQLREALVHYRALFSDLLGDEPVDPDRDPVADPDRDAVADPDRDPVADPDRDPAVDSDRDTAADPDRDTATKPRRKEKQSRR